MNSTSSDWNTKLRQAFDHLPPSVISSLSNTFTQDILFIIGFITVSLLVLILIFQFVLKVRQIYRTTERKTRYKKSKYPSYQKLLDSEKNQCQCFHSSCLPKFQCIKPSCQIYNSSSHYEQIDERQRTNSIYRVYPCSHLSCIRVHIVK